MENSQELFNSVIRKGWKPFGREKLNYCQVDGGFVCFFTLRDPNKIPANLVYESLAVPLRVVVSLESGFWQFVVANNLYRRDEHTDYTIRHTVEDARDSETVESFAYGDSNSNYWILKSSLVRKEELDNFLLENIVERETNSFIKNPGK